MQDLTTAVAPKKSLAQAWAVCMTAALYFFYIFIQMTKFNAIGHDLTVEFKIGSTELGTLSSFYFWGNVIFLFPAGLLLDRFSTKAILGIVMTVSVVSTFLFSFTHGVASAAWCFLAIGLAGAFALIISLRLISRWFPPEKMAMASGLAVTIGFLGAMVSQSPLTWLVSVVGWRSAMQWDAGLGVVLLILMMIIVKDFPAGASREISQEQATSLSFLWQSIKKAVTNRQNWLFGIYTSLVNLPLFVFGAVFGVPCLQTLHNVTAEQAAFTMLIMFIGAMAGSPAFGWLSDKMRSRKAPMFIGGIVSLILVLSIMYVPNINYALLYVLFFAIGFFTSAQVITYAVIPESNTDDVIATSLSIGSTLIMAGGLLLPIFGWLLDLYWGGQMSNGAPLHSISEYRFALWLLPISFIIGMIAIMFGKETNCKKIV